MGSVAPLIDGQIRGIKAGGRTDGREGGANGCMDNLEDAYNIQVRKVKKREKE